MLDETSEYEYETMLGCVMYVRVMCLACFVSCILYGAWVMDVLCLQ